MPDEFDAKKARAKRPIPFWCDAFHRDTQHLEADEVGAYFLLLMAMWRQDECSLSDDDSRLARIARVSVRLWKSRIGPVMREFFQAENGSLFSKRLRQEAGYVERHVTQQSSRGKAEKSHKPLKKNNMDKAADEPRNDPQTHPTQLPNYPTLEDRDTNVSLVRTDIVKAVERFNNAAEKAGWPKVQKLSDARSKHLRKRLEDAGGPEGWEVALRKAYDSDFLNGRTTKSWTGFGFDWMVNAANFTKLMEGNYDNRTGNSGHDQPGTHRPGANLFEAAARVAASRSSRA